MRSNDAYKAAFMNIYAFIELQEIIAKELNIEVGEYVHIADSYHVYGSYFDEFNGFLNMVKNRTFEQRVWNSNYGIPMYIEACDKLLSEENMPENKKEIIINRKNTLLNKIV